MSVLGGGWNGVNKGRREWEYNGDDWGLWECGELKNEKKKGYWGGEWDTMEMCDAMPRSYRYLLCSSVGVSFST